MRHEDGKLVTVLRGGESPLLNAPAVSPDGESLAVTLPDGERVRLLVIDTPGSMPRGVSGAVDVRGSPAWSPDGDWIAVGGEDASGPGLFLSPRDGGEPRRLVEGPALNPVWSPRDDLIVYCDPQVGPGRPVRGVRPESGENFDLPDIRVIRKGERVRFLPDGRGLVYMEGLRSGQDFVRVDLETMEKRTLARFDDRAEMRAFDIDPVGESIVFDRREQNSDIVRIEVPQDRTR